MTRLSFLAACVGSACVALLHAQTPPLKSLPGMDDTKWIENCLKDFESVKVGMTRAQVEGKLPKDGGIQAVSPVRFTHPACSYFKIDVEFEFKRDAANQNRAIRDEADRVKNVSKPYIERPFFD